MSRRIGKRVAVVGATGVVGTTIAQVLTERRFAVDDFVPVATAASGTRSIAAFGRDWTVRAADDTVFDGVDLCFFTAGAAVSRELVPAALDAGCRVVDNTTAFRMEKAVPLVVPEINGDQVTADSRLVSCPNCTTINLVMALAPIRGEARLQRVVVTSFQSVSGAGREAVTELEEQAKSILSGQVPRSAVFAKPIAFNCVPQVGDITASGNTIEEEKIVEETRKILGMPDLEVSATAVRVPVRVGHSLSVNAEFAEELTVDRAMARWRSAAGVSYDDGLPTPADVAGSDTVVVGRLRRDPSRPHALNFWVVGDNLRKGAATNSVQIAELWAAA